jgi:gamma-glutamyltranspeptidase
LAAHTSTWETPIHTTYRGLRIYECPPNGQGLTALIALNILEGFDLASLDPLGVERLHLEIEALRLAFADTRWFVADPATNPAPLEGCFPKPMPPSGASSSTRSAPRWISSTARRWHPRIRCT